MRQFNTVSILSLVLICLVFYKSAEAQSRNLERPFIWVKSSERQEILQKIEDNEWANSLYNSLKERVDTAVTRDLKQRREKLEALPLVWGEEGSVPTLQIYEKGHAWNNHREPTLAMMKGLQDAIDCGVLYYLTGDEKYAIFAADMLAAFVNALVQIPVDVSGSGNSGWLYTEDHLIEVRVVAAQIPIIYDFVYPYLKSGGKVYDLASDELRSFDFEAGQKVFKTYVDLALNTGSRIHNWTVLESTSLIQNMMAIDDETERNRLLAYVVDKDTERQASFELLYKNFEKPGSIWPESFSYSLHVTTLSIFHMTMIDRIYPELKLGNRFPNISQSIAATYNLKYPNGDNPTFGDANRNYNEDYLSYEMGLQLAKLNENQQQITYFTDFLSSRLASGDYERGELTPRKYGPATYKDPLWLLWSNADLQGDAKKNVDPPRPRSNHLPHAGLTIQRNISKNNPIKNSLMAVIGGGSFVHSHASGMELELYGQGYVLGTDGGKGTYASPLHENYYRLFAAHNTVISNGGSGSNPNGGWVNLGIDTVTPVVLEPRAGDPGVSPNHSFATTKFSDKFNTVAAAEHQRTVALIRLNDEHGYYLDVFRAKSDTINQFHDYLYHNVADRLEISTDGKALTMNPDKDRYQASSKLEWERNRKFRHPGWHYFDEVKSSQPTSDAFVATFTAENLEEKPIVMKAVVPAGLEAEVTQVLAPPSSSAPPSYKKKPLPAFLLRHQGEAWSNPFVVVYEAHNSKPVIQSVERLMEEGVFKGVKVVSKVEEKILTQYILVQENIEDIYTNYELGISFKGRFGLITLLENNVLKEMYIGDGHQLSYNGETLKTDQASNAAYMAK